MRQLEEEEKKAHIGFFFFPSCFIHEVACWANGLMEAVEYG